MRLQCVVFKSGHSPSLAFIHCLVIINGHCFCTTGGCQKYEVGYEEDFLTLEGPGVGGDKHCCSLQFPGTVKLFP